MARKTFAACDRAQKLRRSTGHVRTRNRYLVACLNGARGRYSSVVIRPNEGGVMKKTRTRWLLILSSVVIAGALAGSSLITSCGEEDCLVAGENCSSSYLEANGKVGWRCCDGLACESGIISGVLVCQ